MSDDLEQNLFVAECMRLDAFITMYCSTGYSDREICSVLSTILKRVVDRQPDPEVALEQLIEALKRKDS